MKKKRLTIAVVLVCALLLGIAGTVYAVGYTYGQYNMTYLPGTTDTVTNMPANETGLTPGSDSPYTVSSTVPVREGFEFIDWELTWGTMEAPATPVDYSNAITVSKTATAAAAGDANTARAYTITLEAKVNINTDDPTGLFVENLTACDTIQDEFDLEDAGITATILDEDGNVVSMEAVPADDENLTIIRNFDGTTDVCYNFGKVYSSHTARLSFDITAKEDYIGSNSVYSNVGTPEFTYTHTVIDKDGNPTSTVRDYSVNGTARPQVNVPIRFDVGNGTVKTVDIGEEVNLAELDAEKIVELSYEAAGRYDQTNGTLSYEWEAPDGTRYAVPDTIHVSGGAPEKALPDAETLKNVVTADSEGEVIYKLHVTFTPDAVSGDEEFSDETTAQPVWALTKYGTVGINAENRKSAVNYIVFPDPVYGSPENATIIEPMTDIPYGSDVTLAGQPAANQDYWVNGDGASVPGSWAFYPNGSETSQEGWNTKEDLTGDAVIILENVTEDTTVYGQWVFTPDTYTLTYQVLPDAVYGVPRRVSGMPTEMTDISYGSSVELAGFPTAGVAYAYDTNGVRILGTWRFRGSLTDSSFGWNSEASLDGDFYSTLTDIKENVTLYGQWVFTPDFWG